MLFSEQIQRIDANTEDVVDNVQGAQRELMKYWSRVSGNRWLVAKMFGVLMVRLYNLHSSDWANYYCRYSFYFGFSLLADWHCLSTVVLHGGWRMEVHYL